jgi:c-di-AMP phosphodiesterase-like protein
MQSELTACIILAIIVSAICVIMAIKKMWKIFVAILLLAIFFIFRAILLWLAAGYVPPNTIPDVEFEAPLELPDADFSLPKPRYFDTGRKGFGAD